MLVIWYNPIKKDFYCKVVKHYFQDNVRVGYSNGYGHSIVAMFFIDTENDELIPCTSIRDYRSSYEFELRKKKDNSLKNKTIDRTIKLLSSIKK